MAVTKFQGGWSMTAAGDTASDAGGNDIQIDRVIVVKATAGTVTFKDGNGVIMLLTNTLADASMTQLDFGGARVSSFEFDALSAGTATVAVYGAAVGGRSAK